MRVSTFQDYIKLRENEEFGHDMRSFTSDRGMSHQKTNFGSLNSIDPNELAQALRDPARKDAIQQVLRQHPEMAQKLQGVLANRGMQNKQGMQRNQPSFFNNPQPNVGFQGV